MVTFVVKKKSVFFSQAAFQLFKFIQSLFIYLPFSSLKRESFRPGRGLPLAHGMVALHLLMARMTGLTWSERKTWKLARKRPLRGVKRLCPDLGASPNLPHKGLIFLMERNSMFECFKNLRGKCISLCLFIEFGTMRGPINAMINIK